MTVTTDRVRTTLASCLGVSVVYPVGDARVTALDGVDFEVEGGERIAILGRSGSGKTTLLHVLGGLTVPTSGVALWHGGELSSLDAAARSAARAQGIGYVFQAANLLPYFSAYENVAFAAEVSGRTGTDAEELLGLVGLERKLDSLPSELSGGEQQRVAIARALSQGPELLLCDEPTGHLDSDTAGRVLDLFDRLHEELGFALVVATHDRRVADRYDRRVELADGRVVGEEGA
ncbi:MAG: lipoprotein-releasing system ATP-binding protein [Thermoleophilaceae bacterium]|nr:lipoprotein-releasing system ATP-binding protein [Thermoleophilaceae bacterium]